MDLKDHKIEVVIGPYEVYEDALFNYKASFESFLTIKDQAESEKLEIFKSYLRDMEIHLPIPDEHKNKTITEADIAGMVAHLIVEKKQVDGWTIP